MSIGRASVMAVADRSRDGQLPFGLWPDRKLHKSFWRGCDLSERSGYNWKLRLQGNCTPNNPPSRRRGLAGGPQLEPLLVQPQLRVGSSTPAALRWKLSMLPSRLGLYDFVLTCRVPPRPYRSTNCLSLERRRGSTGNIPGSSRWSQGRISSQETGCTST